MSIKEATLLDKIPKRDAPSSRHDRKKWEIMLTAANLFIQKGTINTGVREIADACGITIGTVYYYFKSKDDIIESFLDYSMYGTNYFQKASPAALDAVGPEEALKLAIKAYIESVIEAQNIVLFWHQETKNVKPEFRKKLMDAELGLIGQFENIIKLGQKNRVFNSTVDPRLAAHNIIVLADMWAFRRWDIGKRFISDVFLSKQVDFIMRSLMS